MSDRQQIAADWATRGFTSDLWTDPRGRRREDFTYATDELATLLEGDMEFEVQGWIQHPQLGEELLIPVGEIYSARKIGSMTAHWLYGFGRRQESARKVRTGSS